MNLSDDSLRGKILAEDIHNAKGLLLLSAGTVLGKPEIRLLRRHAISAIKTFDEPDRQLQPDGFLSTYKSAIDQLKDLFGKIGENSVPPYESFLPVVYPIIDAVLKGTIFFDHLFRLEGSAEYTYRHSINVSIYSALIGRLLRRSKEEIFRLGQAGILHDLGKLLIPKKIIVKPGKLSPAEFSVMKTHTTKGFALLKKMGVTDKVLLNGALLHHERRDGSGYPEGRAGDDIPEECEIIAVADVFDALTSNRVYKTADSPLEAAELLWKEACANKLNPLVVIPFINYLASVYTGKTAVLNDGEKATIVMIFPNDPRHPLVKRGEEYLDLRTKRDVKIERFVAGE